MKTVLLSLSSILVFQLSAQTQTWHTFMDTVPSFSSPRAVDLNGDGILDIVLGGGIDGIPAENGIMAFNGLDGTLLWKRPTHDEIFVSANFQDINGDGIPDVFIGGREAQFYAINGSNGDLIWQFYPHPFSVSPGDSGIWNFYSPQFIPDINNDGLNDILVANGGDHSLPLWETNRPPGHLMILNAANGGILAQAVVPDSAETYCSPLVVDLKGDGVLWVLFGTGGESIGGSFYVVPLNDLINQNISNAWPLATHATRGFIAPPSVHKSITHNGFDIIVQGFGGTIYKFNGQTFAQEWATTISGTESSAQPVLGNFTGGDFVPDVFAVLFKGNMTSYTDYYQVMLDGTDGSIQFIDSIGSLHFPSGNAVDLNNDGRDEAIASITFHQNGYFHHKLMAFDFQNDTIYQIHQNIAGTNLGCTPLIRDLDNDGNMDLVYVVRADSLNPVGLKGIHVFRLALDAAIPNSGIAWGSYLGTNIDGVYNYTPTNCGFGSIIAAQHPVNPSCNGLSDGSIALTLIDPSDNHTYLWSNGSVSPILQNVPAGDYTITVTNSAGCYENRIISLFEPYLISSGGIQAPSCHGLTNGTATVSSTGCPCMFNTCVFTWSDGFNGAYHEGLGSGEHTVTILHPDGCVVTQNIVIPNGPSIFIDTIVSHISCYNANDGQISLVNDGASPSYSYSFNDSLTQLNQFGSLSAGVYSVSLMDSIGCLSETLLVTITEPDSLALTINAEIESAAGLGDGSAAIVIQGGTPPYSIAWDDDQNQTTWEATNLSGGVYGVTVTDANGCSTSASIVVNTLNLPDIESKAWNIYPNPSTEIVHIQGPEAFVYELRELSGKLILTGTSSVIDITPLSAGSYFLHVTSQQTTWDTKLLIVR